MADEKLQPERVWRRVHRPEEYAGAAARWLAAEIGVPRQVLAPFVPLVKSALSRWEPAAEEVSVLVTDPDGGRVFRTFFSITSYSSHAVYGMAERVLRRLGAGRSRLERDPDTEFAWILIGGVLNDYAGRAGLCEDSTCRLLEFRLRNSDYLTATTWFGNCVEIANLETGRVERLELPELEIRKVVDWSVGYHERRAQRTTRRLEPGKPGYEDYLELAAAYRRVVPADVGDR